MENNLDALRMAIGVLLPFPIQRNDLSKEQNNLDAVGMAIGVLLPFRITRNDPPEPSGRNGMHSRSR
jgi:hypothetical protein